MGIAERKEREKEQRRLDILKAAKKIFFNKGFEPSTMDDIAEQAELSKGTLYSYFKSKEDLKFVLFMEGADILKNNMLARISSDKSGIDNLLELGATFLDFAREHKKYFELMIHFESIEYEILNFDKEKLMQFFTRQSPLAIVLECVKKGIQDKSLRNDLNPERLAATLWSQMMGIIIVVHGKREIHNFFGLTPENIILTHFDIAINGARNQSAKP